MLKPDVNLVTFEVKNQIQDKTAVDTILYRGRIVGYYRRRWVSPPPFLLWLGSPPSGFFDEGSPADNEEDARRQVCEFLASRNDFC
jgi:hypothetical protein